MSANGKSPSLSSAAQQDLDDFDLDLDDFDLEFDDFDLDLDDFDLDDFSDEAASRTLLCGHPASEDRWDGDRCTICEKRCTDEAAPGIALAKSGDLQALEKWLMDNIDKKDSIHKGGVTKAGTRHNYLLRRIGSHPTLARVLCSPAQSSCGAG